MKHEKRALVVRYGALGDAMQATSILPHLKSQGYHVTVDVNEKQAEVISNDPHIDALIITKQGTVPLEKLSEFWSYRSIGYDLVINFSEATEGALLKFPSRPDYYWPDSARRKHCAYNYVEFLHMVANVPYDGPRHRFYPTGDELRWAKDYAEKNAPLILFQLAGSGPHKVWPWSPSLVVRILANDARANIVLVGDENHKQFEADISDACVMYHGKAADRLHFMTGTHKVREVLALAQQAHIVVGPESIVASAVAVERNLKVVLLSHSTKENLTRDWKNTVSIEPDPKIAPCYPCHRMHYDVRNCPRHEKTQTSLCQSSITVDRVFEPIQFALAAFDRATAEKGRLVIPPPVPVPDVPPLVQPAAPAPEAAQ